MKKIISLILAVSSAMILAACNGGGESRTETTAPVTTAPETTAATTAPKEKVKEADLSKLHAVDSQGDRFAGIWHITDGTGSQLENFFYEFDGNKKAYLMVGTMGYCGTYDVKTEDGKDVFFTQLMFGLNGSYTYEFSKDGKTVVLTSVEDETTSTLERADDYSPIPEPLDDPVIDKNLLGAWKDDTGEYLYFGSDGIMYETQATVTFTFYNYTAADGVITQIYTMIEETEETAAYKVEGDVLTYNGYKYDRISADELV